MAGIQFAILEEVIIRASMVEAVNTTNRNVDRFLQGDAPKPHLPNKKRKISKNSFTRRGQTFVGQTSNTRPRQVICYTSNQPGHTVK